MTRSATPELEDDLRALFAAQADTIEVEVAALDETLAPLPTVGHGPDRRRRVAVTALSVAAAIALVVGLTVLTRDDGRADVVTGDQTTSVAITPDTSEPSPTAPTTSVPTELTVDPIDSLDEFRSRVEATYSLPGARVLLGEVVIGEAKDLRTSPDEPLGYGVNVVVANGARGGISAGDHLLPLGRPETMLSGEIIKPVSLPAGIDEGVLSDNGQSVAVALRGDDQFVTIRVEKLDTKISPSSLIAIAGAFLVPPQPAPATGPAVSELGRFTATVMPDGFFESSVEERVDPTSTSLSMYFLTGTDQQEHMSDRRLNVTTIRDTDADAVIADIGASEGVRVVDVRGHEALFQIPFSPSLQPSEEQSLVWIESPTMLVFVNGRGLTDAELLAVANGLRPR